MLPLINNFKIPTKISTKIKLLVELACNEVTNFIGKGKNVSISF